MDWTRIIDGVVIVGVAVVLPLALGRTRWWLLASVGVVASVLIPTGMMAAGVAAAPWLPMALAVAWASSLYWDVPALSIPDMVRTHGVMNAVFVVAGLFARHLQQPHSGRNVEQPQPMTTGGRP